MERIRKFIAYIGLHTFGMKMIYPGSCFFMPKFLGLNSRRAELLQDYGCEVKKIKTKDNNIIDTIFMDSRNQGIHGETLVICCEGSASFYEDGCLIRVPMEAGYSMLGWNHPGFGNSTGKPMPSQEQNAIDAVVKYAIFKLKFKRKNILFYCWSIGAYTGSWAVINYPSCRGIILDAAFDEMLNLAKNATPQWLHNTVEIAIKKYVDLNVLELLKEYCGPILLIRRTRDEITCLEAGNLSTNRANILLMEIFTFRFPNLITSNVKIVLNKYLSVTGKFQEHIVKKYKVDKAECLATLKKYVSEDKKVKKYPMLFGKELGERQKVQLILFLASKYMIEFDATHCTPLPSEMFQEPWNG
ncbi:unnamed protein product [Brassicogethes aeneus]|uniref:Uncharacterized protein n=1 Tax=Brassicogethes aeneus TaxID=1431903 RepID=A0A9P0AT84_BRAAE|nr:unnamed protein product [Brassicogethes aeneus]